jgi:hypothetical protein
VIHTDRTPTYRKTIACLKLEDKLPGDAAAHALKTAANAVKFAGVGDPHELLANVHKSLVVLLWTREECDDCGED